MVSIIQTKKIVIVDIKVGLERIHDIKNLSASKILKSDVMVKINGPFFLFQNMCKVTGNFQSPRIHLHIA